MFFYMEKKQICEGVMSKKELSIKKVSIIGMGALGLLYGVHIAEKHSVYVPENRFLYRRAKEIEAEYANV